jgi:hypothetical protein
VAHRVDLQEYSSSESVTSASPWYYRLADLLVRTGGPGAVIAVLLCWYLVSSMNIQLRAITEMMTQANVKMTAFAASQQRFDDQRERLLDKQLVILRQMCVNSAKTETALKACLE